MSIRHAKATIEVMPDMSPQPTRYRAADGIINLKGNMEQDAGEYILDVNSKAELEEALAALANENIEKLEKYLKPKEE